MEAQLSIRPGTKTAESLGRDNSPKTGVPRLKPLRSPLSPPFAPCAPSVVPTFLSCYKKGLSRSKPAESCADVYKCNPHAKSGSYWLKTSSGRVKRVKCSMGEMCGIKGGWMLVTKIDAKRGCPRSMKRVNANWKKVCVKKNKKCSSAKFSARGIPYSYVCGMAKGYAYSTPDAFRQFHNNVGLDQVYVDGVSITHGRRPRKHIWTYAAGSLQNGSNRRGYGQFMCPCAIGSTQKVPSFVYNHYYCEAASNNANQKKWYMHDPLWDGAGCPLGNSCCSSSGMPWFKRDLPAPTTDRIEVRLCADQSARDENVGLAKLEVYVRASL